MSIPTPVPVPVVPAQLRFVLYWVSWGLSTVAGVVSAGWQIIAAASPDVTAPLWIKLAAPLLLLVVAQLNALAGSNVTNQASLVVRRQESGTTSLLLIGCVLAVVGLLLWILTVLDVIGLLLLVVGILIALYAFTKEGA